MTVAKIHPTAIIDQEVQLGDVEIGAYAIIRGNVTVGDSCIIMDHATVYGNLKMGKENIIHPGAVIGNAPQDISYRGEPTWVEIGDNNVFREFVTINRGTKKGHGKTTIGSNNLLMAYSHVAHDCSIGNNCQMPNACSLGGHVVIGDHVHTGGNTGIHQFVTLGNHAFVGFQSRIIKDVPPYIITEGNPAQSRTINQIGLERSGFTDEEIGLLKQAFKTLYVSDILFAEKLKILEAPPFSGSAHVQYLKNFVAASSEGKNGRAQEAGRR
jgi:UDP-N-acetylglucosamine acyltransferase